MILADEEALRIYDGRTGTVVFEDTRHSSATLWEYPAIADVDGDGSTEIVIAQNSGDWQGVAVYGHAAAGWHAAGPTWATHDFAVTNVQPDGHVPSPAVASWRVHNVFRARPAVDALALPDLLVSVDDACVAGTGPVQLSLHAENQGAVDVPAGVSVAIYADRDGVLDLVHALTLPAVPAGTVLAGVAVELDRDAAEGVALVVVVDDDGSGAPGAVVECDEGNNRDRW